MADPDLQRRERMICRLMANAMPEPNSGCWLWVGTITFSGYGRIEIDGQSYASHRLMFDLIKGPVPKSLVLDHLCRVRSCCNPDHLEAVPQRENVRRGVSAVAKNFQKTHCPRGHLLAGENLVPSEIRNRGWRECKQCHHGRTKQRRRRIRESGVDIAASAQIVRRSHCKHGHPMTPDNMIPSALRQGFQSCATCYREQGHARRKRRKAERDGQWTF